MRRLREFIGYLLGGLLFVALMPTIMWLVSGRPALWPIGAARAIVAIILMLGGLSLSIWTIVYMRQRGKGNPMDAFGHEVAPRTKHLMTDGPLPFQPQPHAHRHAHLPCRSCCMVVGTYGIVCIGAFLLYHDDTGF